MKRIVFVVLLMLFSTMARAASLEWDESVGAIGYRIYTSTEREYVEDSAGVSNYKPWVMLWVADAAPVELKEGEEVIQAMVFPIPEAEFDGTVFFRATAINHSGESGFSNAAMGSFGVLEPPTGFRFILPMP